MRIVNFISMEHCKISNVRSSKAGKFTRKLLMFNNILNSNEFNGAIKSLFINSIIIGTVDLRSFVPWSATHLRYSG